MAASNERKMFRCAIYTRKSPEHGLEQDFNSLDARREVAEAYIKSVHTAPIPGVLRGDEIGQPEQRIPRARRMLTLALGVRLLQHVTNVTRLSISEIFA
jgi:hypothetical protein